MTKIGRPNKSGISLKELGRSKYDRERYRAMLAKNNHEPLMPLTERTALTRAIDALAAQLAKSFPMMGAGLRVDALVMATILTTLRNKLLI